MKYRGCDSYLPVFDQKDLLLCLSGAEGSKAKNDAGAICKCRETKHAHPRPKVCISNAHTKRIIYTVLNDSIL